MQTKFNLYPKEQLPENFKFPQSYIDLSSNMEKINELEYFPWWFEDPDYENSEIEDSVYPVSYTHLICTVNFRVLEQDSRCESDFTTLTIRCVIQQQRGSGCI